ncbi:hypothetical protein D3C81_1336800 [compost metagenome]
MLGGADVRAAQQQVGRQAGGQLGQQLVGRTIARRQVGRDRRAEQQLQGVGVLGDLAGIQRLLYPRLLHQAARLAHVEVRRGADLAAGLDQAQALGVAVQGRAGQFQLGLVAAPGQVGDGDVADQGDLHAALRLGGGQVLLQGRALKAAQTTEQVQLVGDPERCLVLALDARYAARRQVGGQPLAAGAAAGVDRREPFGALDPVQRAVRLDVQHRLAQVAVVVQGGIDQLLQRWVAKELLPAQLGSSASARPGLAVGRTLRPVGLDRCRRTLVIRDQAATGQR